MGSSIPSDNEMGSISLAFNTKVCIAGIEFRGKVALSIRRQYKLDSFDLKITGEETMKKHESDHTYFDKVIKVMDKQIVLDVPTKNGFILPGNYIIPFSLIIANGYPASYPLERISGGLYDLEGGIEYKCSAYLADKRRNYEMESVKEFTMTKNLIFTPDYELTTKNGTKGLRLRSYGEFRVILNKNAVYRNEPILVHVILDCTYSRREIPKIVCKLVQRTRLTYHDFNDDVAIDKKKIQIWELPGANVKELNIYTKAITLPNVSNNRFLETIESPNLKRYYLFKAAVIYPGGDRSPNLSCILDISSLPVSIAEIAHLTSRTLTTAANPDGFSSDMNQPIEIVQGLNRPDE